MIFYSIFIMVSCLQAYMCALFHYSGPKLTLKKKKFFSPSMSLNSGLYIIKVNFGGFLLSQGENN